MTDEVTLRDGDLYVHVGDDGGIFASPANRQLSAWLTLPDLRLRLQALAFGARVYLSTERGSPSAAPAREAVLGCGLEIWTTVAIEETHRRQGMTALISAAGVGSMKLLEDLLERGEDPEQRDDLGRTALMVAAARGEQETMRCLISVDANLEARDKRGFTALSLAASFDHTGAAKLLLDAGADPEARTNDGLTAYDIASSNGYRDVAALLPPSRNSAPTARSQPPTQPRPLRLPWLRRPGVMIDTRDEFRARTYDGSPIRAFGLIIGAMFFCFGVAGALSGTPISVVYGLAVLVGCTAVFWVLATLIERQQLRIANGRIQTRPLTRWRPSISLENVAAACYTNNLHGGPALQLLNSEYGPKRSFGARKWYGVQPQPSAPDGSELSIYAFQLGTHTVRGRETQAAVLAALAPFLLRPSVLLDDATRQALEAARVNR